jgi:hypothetical protein
MEVERASRTTRGSFVVEGSLRCLEEASVLARWIVGGLAIVVVISSPPLGAQVPRPLVPLPEKGLRVVPFFDGWYANPDGTISFSFGYSNLNKDTVVEIPLGPDNFIVPKEYDGRQPTTFLTLEGEQPDGGGGPARGAGAGGGAGAAPGAGAGAAPGAAAGAAATPDTGAARGGGAGGGAGANRGRDRDRERGVFTVTVPGDYKGDVVWTLRYAGQTFSVPARAKSSAYQLSWPAAMGSVPPLLRFQPSGTAGRGPTGIQAPPLQARVGVPVPMTIWLTDDGVHEKEPIKFGRERPGMNVSWYKHSGPGPVDFDPPKSPFPTPTGESSTKATFKEPGDYVVRVKADTFGYADSSSGNQCCWTNGYQRVTVTR